MKWNPADVEVCPPRPAAGTSGCSSGASGASGLGSSGSAEIGSAGGFAKACAKSRKRESVQRHHISKSGPCNAGPLDPREIPWNSPSPERIPRISNCLTSLSSPRSRSAAASTTEISESSRPSGDTLGCREDKESCNRRKCRSRETLSNVWLWQKWSRPAHGSTSRVRTSTSAIATIRRSASNLSLSARSRASVAARSASEDWEQRHQSCV